MRIPSLSRLIGSLFVGILLFQAAATPAHAQLMDWTTGTGDTDCVQEVTFTDPGQTTQAEVATLQGVGCLVRNILAITTTAIGLAGFVMLVVGAFLYLTSGGQSKHIDTAKQTITYAVIGIVVSLTAFFILNFIASFTGARNILRFDIYEEIDGNGAGGPTSPPPASPAPSAPPIDPNNLLDVGASEMCLVQGTHSGCRCQPSGRTAAKGTRCS